LRFLVDRCAGRRLAKWLSDEGHDVVGAWVWEPDPGDEALLALATAEDRILARKFFASQQQNRYQTYTPALIIFPASTLP